MVSIIIRMRINRIKEASSGHEINNRSQRTYFKDPLVQLQRRLQQQQSNLQSKKTTNRRRPLMPPPPTKQRSSGPHTASSNEKMEGRRHSSGSSGSGSDSPKLRTGVQQVVHKPPTPATPVLHQQQHVAEANKPSEGAAIVMKHFAANILQKGVAGLAQEFAEIQQLTGKNIPDHEQYSKHPARNRYTDIYCIDKTRVVLNYPPGDANDYIHANWIRGFPVLGKVDGKDKEIIATQAPLEKTIRDFWRMIWQEKVSVIVMLCQLVEGGRKKADLYWPWAAKDKKKVDNLELEIVNEAVEEDEVKQLRTTSLVVRGRSLKTGELREHRVTHVMWRGWPDKDVPTSSVQAIQLVNKVHGTNSSVVCVHCSAGIGRTGTIVALEIAIRTLQAGQDLSVWNIICKLREMRHKSCQTAGQYLYIHYALLSFFALKDIVKKDQLKEFQTDYLQAVATKKKPKQQPSA